MTILSHSIPLQPRYPLVVDTGIGPYSAVYDVASSLRQDFMFLLMTLPGQWPGDPERGVGMEKYLFENKGSEILDTLIDRIKNQIRKYMPGKIVLVNVGFKDTPDNLDNHISVLKIYYKIPDLKVTDALTVKLPTHETGASAEIEWLYNGFLENFRIP